MKDRLSHKLNRFRDAVLTRGELSEQDWIFARNFILFTLLILLTFGSISYITVKGNSTVDRSEIWITHTQDVLNKSERINTLIEAVLADQRGYILSGDRRFLKAYEEDKKEMEQLLAQLKELVQDNEMQMARLTQMTSGLKELTLKLEARAKSYRPTMSRDFVAGVHSIAMTKETLSRVNRDLIATEQSLLEARVKRVELKKSNYALTFLIATGLSAALLVLMNAFLLRAQYMRNRAERSLQEKEARFALAIEGANDGIFDYNLETGEIYFSKRVFGMLGDDRGSVTGTKEDFLTLMHPDDKTEALDHLDRYLKGELPEYSQNFRVRHTSGDWIWVRSRAKAIRDDAGRPLRMVGSHTDITELKEQQLQLEKEIIRADKANRAKTDFLAHMSHEIRTPLTAISGIAEILSRQKDRLDEKQQSLVKTLSTSTMTLKDLINDILDFSKIESGELELSQEAFLLDEMFQQLVSVMGVGAKEKGLDFVCDYGDLKGVNYLGDQVRIRQVLFNLVGNAVKFTDKGSVKIRGSIDMVGLDEFVRIDVMDTGIGIAEKDLEHIFDRFKQVDSSQARRHGGSGLGLAISKRIVAMMGGQLKVSSVPGKGSVFTALLPLQMVEPVQQLRPVTPEKAGGAPVRPKQAVQGKALIVEDYEGNIVVVSYMLDEMGVGYDVARNGVEALEKWSESDYDVILMDVQMPKMDGFEATRRIRLGEAQKKPKRHTPIIGMTAHALVGDKDKCIASGMDSYFPKPIVEADLRKKILEYLNKKAA
jgi:PAS domain S-box-containing protein